MTVIGKDKISLQRNGTVFVLSKLKVLRSTDNTFKVKKIEIKILDLRYFVDRSLVLDDDDWLTIYEMNTDVNGKRKESRMKLPSGYFLFLVKKIAENNVLNARELYDDEVCGRQIQLQVTIKDGHKKKIRSEGFLPDNLQRLIIPLMYCDDLLNYPELSYKINFKKY